MELSAQLRQKIIGFLVALPNIHDSGSQRAFVLNAGLDAQLQNQILFGKPSAQFFPLLVSNLLDYGTLHDGRQALAALLDSAKQSVGQDKQTQCDELIREVEQEISAQFATMVQAEVLKAGVEQDVGINTQDFLAIPDALWERYEQIELIGRGGLSEVYKVRNRRVNSLAALKILLPRFHSDPQTIARFWAEGKKNTKRFIKENYHAIKFTSKRVSGWGNIR